jgi:hypothetical protein
MHDGQTQTQICEMDRRLEGATSRAFLAAHLLTASAQQAESAVLEAIDSWDPDGDTEEALFQRVLKIALRRQSGPAPLSSNLPEAGASLLPPELEAVLRLAPPLRCCFVLRVLAGFSRQVSAQLLDLLARQVDQYTNAAMKCLPFLTAQPNAGVEYLVWNRRLD